MPMKCGFFGKHFFLDILNKHAPIINIQVKGNKIPYVTSELKKHDQTERLSWS